MSCLRLVVACGSFGLPTAFPCGHRCTVGIDRDPPECLDAQGGIKAKRQPFVVGVVLKSCCLGRGRRVVVNILSDVVTENTYSSRSCWVGEKVERWGLNT